MNAPPPVAIERRCPRCHKRLARLNRGPLCFACAPLEEDASGSRPRRSRLPHDLIIATYMELRDTTRTARTLGLPRSSVWYAVQRAKTDGRIPDEEAVTENQPLAS